MPRIGETIGKYRIVDQLGRGFELRALGSATLRGRGQELEVFDVIG